MERGSGSDDTDYRESQTHGEDAASFPSLRSSLKSSDTRLALTYVSCTKVHIGLSDKGSKRGCLKVLKVIFRVHVTTIRGCVRVCGGGSVFYRTVGDQCQCIQLSVWVAFPLELSK